MGAVIPAQAPIPNPANMGAVLPAQAGIPNPANLGAVIPAQAGIQFLRTANNCGANLDSRLRGNDGIAGAGCK